MDSLAAGVFGHGAGFEGEEVALDGFFGLAEFLFYEVEFVLPLASLLTGPGVPGIQGDVEEVVSPVGV
ncbi:MAG TPA: hypothetical protein VNG13_16040 [Mycobacteriales bacterium]|nr:hypothetical protein [Mycobacteriales bacterium]